MVDSHETGEVFDEEPGAYEGASFDISMGASSEHRTCWHMCKVEWILTQSTLHCLMDEYRLCGTPLPRRLWGLYRLHIHTLRTT
jgi:hypothetical protein